MSFADFAKGTMSLLFPASCLICEFTLEPLNRSFICSSCWGKIEWLPSLHCIKCGKPFSFPTSDPSIFPPVCLNCRENPPFFQRIFIPTLYRGVTAEAIKLFKYNHKRAIIRGFSKIIRYYLDKVDMVSLKPDGVTCIPLHRKRLKERGFNQAEDIARVLGRYLDCQVWNNLLSRVKNTRPQTELRKEERKKNIKDSFKLRKKIKGKGIRVLLVDDVYTTGSTLNEAARELKKSGLEVFAFTLARAPG